MNQKQFFTSAFLLLAASCARADIVVDQRHVATGPGPFEHGASTSNSDFRRVQTFTVGVSGFLNSIEVFPKYSSLTFGNMNVLDSLQGTGHIVSTTSLVRKTADSVTFDFRALNVAVKAGDVLGFEVFGSAAGGWPLREFYYTRNAVSGDYAGGSDFYLNPSYGTHTFTPTDTDAFFVTTVDAGISPVPEPASYAMLAAGLTLVGAMMRRRRKAGAAMQARLEG